MKPLKLTMSAFGSYGKETVIDFTKVEHGLFLITGDTGAGKTTIFDGITFAIYGETSGGKRDGKMMRSQFAAPTDETFVELTFSYRGETYTVRRTPEYMREKKRGSGLVKAAATVDLTMPDGTAFRGKMKETDKKLCEIMGIDREQFTQIAMIAQGDFLRLLHARSEERKKIFSTIFHTGLYRKVEEELGEKRKELKEKIGGAGERMRAYVQSVEVPEGEKLPEELQRKLTAEAEKLAGLMKEEQPDISGLRGLLEFFMETDRYCLEQIAEPLSEVDVRCGELQEMRGLAKANNDVLDACDAACKKRKLWQEKEVEYTEEKDQLEKAERAFHVHLFAERVNTAEKQMIQAKQLEKESADRLEQTTDQVIRTAETHLQDTERAALFAVMDGTDEQKLAEWIAEWKAREKVLEAAGRKKLDLDTKMTKVERFAAACEKKAADLERRMEGMSAAREHYGILQERFLKEQAGILARDFLTAGKPCPVCGSLEHPAPAALSADAVTEIQVKEAQDRWEQKRSECEALSLELRGDRAKIEEARKQIEEARKEIPEDHEIRRTALNEMIRISMNWIRDKENWRRNKDAADRLQIFAKDAADEYTKARSEAGFDREEMYKEMIAVYGTRSRLDAEKKKNQQYFMTLQEMKTMEETLKKQAEGKHYTDLTLLEQELELWRGKKDTLQKEKEHAVRILKNHQQLAVTLEKEENEYRTVLDEFLVYDGLWQAASGKIKKQVRLDFETFVQRMYFEKILTAANKRFLVFTNGKMKLKSRPLDETGLVGSAGLEINVYVLATGKERDVKTLSGGESFLASLALALGLSDVVQSQAGSIRLESMFVDEGFGALDDGTRDQAMRVLNDLAGDDRLVGIISHVNALKDSIERKLVVTRGLQGSSISWN